MNFGLKKGVINVADVKRLMILNYARLAAGEISEKQAARENALLESLLDAADKALRGECLALMSNAITKTEDYE